MNRRRSARHARRLQVRFWRPGEDRAHAGFTTNISTTGMYVGTNSPVPSGSRLRVEIVDRDHGFVIEGVVMHAKKLPVALQQVTPSGMGIRFLSVEDLLRELLPAVGVAGEARPAPRPEVTEPAPREPAPPPPAPPVRPSEPPPVSGVRPAPQGGGQAARPGTPSPPSTSGGVVTVTFASARDFLQVYRRDLVHGGLFISTRWPGKLNETIEIELCPPGAGQPVRLHARVVHRVEPRSDDLSGAPNLLAGMGVEILDLPAVLARLEPVAAELDAG